jgi:hypothetical protein
MNASHVASRQRGLRKCERPQVHSVARSGVEVDPDATLEINGLDLAALCQPPPLDRVPARHAREQ